MRTYFYGATSNVRLQGKVKNDSSCFQFAQKNTDFKLFTLSCLLSVVNGGNGTFKVVCSNVLLLLPSSAFKLFISILSNDLSSSSLVDGQTYNARYLHQYYSL
ncbi:uncharacterized protein PRCAT00005054001 [Priceomyces carsonii]|uniref:uncharacterized protein n=1 Tax=Priceomyces carsonii TaxID=28549 RepID=UPI002ED948B2|nr:unnamed protein product [Priceomyces carsonii]